MIPITATWSRPVTTAIVTALVADDSVSVTCVVVSTVEPLVLSTGKLAVVDVVSVSVSSEEMVNSSVVGDGDVGDVVIVVAVVVVVVVMVVVVVVVADDATAVVVVVVV